MNIQVEVREEMERGCGFRKSGQDGVGMYLAGNVGFSSCDRLPFPLVDEQGEPVKHFRGLKEINPQDLFGYEKSPTRDNCMSFCRSCPLGNLALVGEIAYVMFVGAENYTIEEFVAEARQQGISKRIGHLPSGFVMGKRIIYLAHIHAIDHFDPEVNDYVKRPGVFGTFRPTALELVIDDPNNIPAKAVELVKEHGAETTKVIKVIPIKQDKPKAVKPVKPYTGKKQAASKAPAKRPSKRVSFDQWMIDLDDACYLEFGSDTMDLPDMLYSQMYEDRKTIKQVLSAIRKANGWEK